MDINAREMETFMSTPKDPCDTPTVYCPYAPDIATINAKIDSLMEMTKELRDHIKTQNGRIGKTEAAIAKLNIVVFSLGGSLAAIAIAYINKLLGL